MESKILIDSHYSGDGQLLITHKPNEEDLRDKMVGRFLWRHAVNKRGFAIIDIFDDHSDSSCKATVKALSMQELAHYLPEIIKMVDEWKEQYNPLSPKPNE